MAHLNSRRKRFLTDMKFNVTKAPKISNRDKNSHKGTFGTALLVCGSYGMAGAAVLAAKAALRSGIGKLKMAVHKSVYGICAVSVPEAVFLPYGLGFKKAVLNDIQTADSILLGCGCGLSKSTLEKLKLTIKNANCPIVIDADGINLLSQNIDILKQAKTPIILTPHPMEMSRLCGKSVREINANRLSIAADFAKNHGVYLVLKGNETVVAAPDGRVNINPTGNAGMATGGSGDVLSGIMAALLAYNADVFFAITSAVYIHGLAGDSAAEKLSETALLPSDIIKELPCVFKTLEG